MIKHICAILWKQLKDTLKNKTILIQFVMFPTLTLIMENAVKMDGMPGHFFSTLFGVMYVGMAPLTAMAAINTLLGQIGQVEMKAEQAGVIIVNMVLAVVLFVIAYKKTGLE